MRRNFAALILFFGLASVCPAQTTTYDSNTTTGADGAFFGGTAHVMQVITVNSPANQPIQITSLPLFGIRWNSNPGVNQSLFLDFYTNVDTSTGSADALLNATYAGGVGIGLPPQAVGSYNYNLTGINVTLPTNTFAVEVTYGDTTGAAFSTALVSRYNTGAPTVGSNDGVVYIDSNLDNVFTGAERSQFNGAVSGTPVATDIRMQIQTVPVPEPTLLGLLGVPVAIGVARRRRSANRQL